MDDKITAILILEILGRPPEHVTKILKEIVDKLGKEKNVSIIKKNLAEPKQIEGKDIFTSFAELEIETDLSTLMLLTFAYMPSHMEIIEPEDLKIKNSDLNMFFNELSKKLHQYDELAKALMIERRIIAQKIQSGEIKVKEGKVKPTKKKVKKKTKKKK